MARKTYRQVITSEENDEKINEKNKKLVERFLKDKSNRVSDLTVQNYSSDLKIFMTWNLLENENKIFPDIKKIEFSDFFSYCIDELKWGSARQNRMRSVLSSFSQFIEKFYDDEYPMFRNVILKVVESAPKSPRREKTILSDEQVEKLLEFLSKKDSQKACWVALAISSGARFGELLRFTTDLIDDGSDVFDGIFIETSKKIRTKGRGKEGKRIYKYVIKDMFVPYYKKWKDEREKILEKNKVEDHLKLFIKKNGTPANDSTVRSWIRVMEKFLGEHIYPHAFRHYTTTYLSKRNIPHNLIRDIFGWESVLMVEVYDDTDMKDREWKELKNLKK